MPILPFHPVRRLTQAEFAELSYEVMRCVFDIHNEFGRFFDEKIYKRELSSRFPRVEIEFPILLTHRTFSTTYYLDALIADGGPFEFKAVEQLAPKHRGQLYNYLLLLDLAHGKLVNLRLESVQHEFVNAMLRPDERRVFDVCLDRWDGSLPGGEAIVEWVVSLLQDWGTGLELALYESAVTHLLGGHEKVLRNVAVQGSRQGLGYQLMRLAAPGVAFRLTAFDPEVGCFEEHARRLLAHADLRAIQWINIGLQKVTFVTVRQTKG
jgi:GxxExxY protein